MFLESVESMEGTARVPPSLLLPEDGLHSGGSGSERDSTLPVKLIPSCSYRLAADQPRLLMA